jgi:hypothetical protein
MNAIQQLEAYHYNYLNHNYHEDVIEPWQDEVIDPNSDPTIDCYDLVKRRLGYRFVMEKSYLQQSVLFVTIRNDGFGIVFNDRPVYLVLKRLSNNALYKFLISGPRDSDHQLVAGEFPPTEVRCWYAGTTFSLSLRLVGITTSVATLADGNVPAVPQGASPPKGSYALYLELPDNDPDRANDERYSIRLASNHAASNTDVWDASTGFNNLFRTVTLNGTSATRMADGEEIFEVGAYPNPSLKSFKFAINTGSHDAITVQVFDMVGKLVELETIDASQVEGFELGSDLTSGIYNVIVRQGENTRNLRIIKQ